MDIKSKIQEIMETGIRKYAAINETTEDNVQIYVTDDPVPEGLNYQIAVNWQPKEHVTFKQIMDKKIDFLGFEALSTPIMKSSIYDIAVQNKVQPSEISFFIYIWKDQIAIAVYKGTENIKTMTLSRYLQDIGIEM